MIDWRQTITLSEMKRRAAINPASFANEVYKLQCDLYRANKIVEITRKWVTEINKTGFDNGPSLTEQECTEQAAEALAVYDAVTTEAPGIERVSGEVWCVIYKSGERAFLPHKTLINYAHQERIVKVRYTEIADASGEVGDKT
jgi:hypothetical protein